MTKYDAFAACCQDPDICIVVYNDAIESQPASKGNIPVIKEQLSHGQAVHRRRILAEHRRDVFDISKRIVQNIEARDRLAQIGKLLSSDNRVLSVMNGQDRERTRAELEIEQIWLQLKCGVITQEEQKQLLSNKFDELEKAMPDVYHVLVNNDHGLSIAQQIRNRVMPPIRVGGYYTKR